MNQILATNGIYVKADRLALALTAGAEIAGTVSPTTGYVIATLTMKNGAFLVSSGKDWNDAAVKMEKKLK